MLISLNITDDSRVTMVTLLMSHFTHTERKAFWAALKWDSPHAGGMYILL